MAGLELNTGSKTRKKVKDIKTDANLLSGNYKDLNRPHRLSFDIDTISLVKFKAICTTKKIKQQDQILKVFMDWLNNEKINL